MNNSKDNRLIGLALPPALWAAHFVLSYAAVSLACAYHVPRLFGLDPAKLVIALATIVVLLLLAHAGRTHYRLWQVAGARNENDSAMRRFFAITSLMLCVLSAAAVMLTGLPALLLPSCVS